MDFGQLHVIYLVLSSPQYFIKKKKFSTVQINLFLAIEYVF